MDKKNRDYLGHRKRIRTRFLRHGLDGFADYEALELMLTWLIPRRDVKPLAKQLLRDFGSVRGVLDAPREALLAVGGIGETAATGILFMRSLIDRYLLERSREDPLPADLRPLKDYCRSRLGREAVEVFHVFFLDTGRRLLGELELERGTLDRAAVYPRQVIDAAMRHGASHVVLAHNHPNDEVEPSHNDKVLTEAIVLAGAPLDIHVLDHLIVSPEKLFSFREAGML